MTRWMAGIRAYTAGSGTPHPMDEEPTMEHTPQTLGAAPTGRGRV